MKSLTSSQMAVLTFLRTRHTEGLREGHYTLLSPEGKEVGELFCTSDPINLVAHFLLKPGAELGSTRPRVTGHESWDTWYNEVFLKAPAGTDHDKVMIKDMGKLVPET